MRFLRFILLTVFCAPLAAQIELDLTSKFTPAHAKPGESVVLEVTAQIPGEYHVYGAFESTGEPIDLIFRGKLPLTRKGTTEIPEGEQHDSFGMTSYWIIGSATLKQTFEVPKDATGGDLQIKGYVRYTACTEDFCLPPAEQPFTTSLTIDGGEAKKPATNPFTGDAKVSLLGVTLDPSPARPGETVTVTLKGSTIPGWHVYGAQETTGVKISMALRKTGGLEAVSSIVIPDGEPHLTGSIESWWIEGPFEVTQKWKIPASIAPGTISLGGDMPYQVCDLEKCLLPDSLPFSADLLVEDGEARAKFVTAENVNPVEAGPTPPTNDAQSAIATGNLLGLIMLSIGAGLFALAMPCTYPMIPITFSFFTKQADERGGRVLPLALTYGLGIITIFVLIGLAIGPAIVPFATNPITNLLIGALFVVFAFSLFGWLRPEPPRFLTDLMGKSSGKGGYVGVFLMGATLVVATFTCTIPFLSTILGASAQTGKLGYVALSMAVFGATMAVPFVALSLIPGKVKAMPRSGEWMNVLKVFLGFVELAAALKFLSNADLVWNTSLISRSTFLIIWTMIFVLAGAFVLGILPRRAQSSPSLGTGRMASGVLTILFAGYCAYGATGKKMDFVMTAVVPPFKTAIHEFVVDDYPRAMEHARKNGKLVLINFTGFT